MTLIRTVDDLMKVLPEDVEFDQLLLNNLATLDLAVDGCVTITGFANGELMSTNTQKGRDRMVEQMVVRMNK